MNDDCQHRRACDQLENWDGHKSPCTNLITHTSVQEQLLTDVHEMKRIMEENSQMLREIKEMVTAWKNVKGFIRTMAVLGTVAKWLTVTGASVGAIWYWLHNK